MTMSTNAPFRILIIDQVHESLQNNLVKLPNVVIDYQPEITKEALVEALPEATVLVLRSKIKLEPELLRFGSKLRLIARAGAGVDEIDDRYLTENQITLINAPEGNRDAVGEHTVGMLLTLFNKLNLADQEVRHKKWYREANRGLEVKGKTVAIIGYGNMGKATAQRLSGFECEVIAYDKYKSDYGDRYARQADMEAVFQKADILSFHIPLLSENRHLVTPHYLDRFQKPIFLLNLARGEVAPFAAVRYGLEKGIVKGAALDVLENEKLQTLTPQQQTDFEFLAASPKVLFSPHVGGWTFESYQRISEVLAEKIAAYYHQM